MWQSDAGTSNDIAKMVADAANSFIETEMLPGFVYSPEHNLYYNSQTGYFYDMRTSLYYHPSTGWLQYNPLTGKYDSLTQQEKEPKVKWKSKSLKKEAEQTLGKDYVDKVEDQDAVDVCESLFDLIDRVTFLSGESCPKKFGDVRYFDDVLGEYVTTSRPTKRRSASPDYNLHDEHLRRKAEEESKAFPPCIRLIDQTDSNKLHIVTIGGALLGWSSKCDVCLKETDALADEHARIKFIEEEQCYQIECLRKRYSTKEPARLEHGMNLVVGPYRFDVHIHNGNNTCGDCEPGILNSKLAVMNESYNRAKLQKRHMNHKSEMRVLKERMGLNEIDERATPSVKYNDRAKVRRKAQGSEPSVSTSSNIYAGCKAEPVKGASTSSVELSTKQAASTSVSINAENKGFKLLKMMGWSEDTGLGKQQQGIVNPIDAMIKNDKKGLGSTANKEQPQFVSEKEKRRQETLAKTKQRFDEAKIL
ncbi:hypothetical protein M3Y97_00953600 [Aphelenchoides bicaudatus]|nr:hypothetical protein M3Y97_00953600 [Aphelenchoides bicaudatus]